MVKRNSHFNQASRATASIPRAVYTFRGQKQPPEFSDGVAAAVGLLRLIAADERVAELVRTEGVSAFLRESFARGGKYAEGVAAAIGEYVTIALSDDRLNLDVWAPLTPAWHGVNCEIPPEDCAFFDVDGIPFSVDATLRTLEWDSEQSSTARNIEEIRQRAKPISRAHFDELRWQVGSARRAARDRQRPAQ